MQNEIILKLCKDIVKSNSFFSHSTFDVCSNLECEKCIFGSRNNNGTWCGEDTEEKYIEIAKRYIDKTEGKEYIKENNEDREVKEMTLKEKILNKINYREVAERIYEMLEDNIAEDVAYNFEAEDIARDMVDGYKMDFIETAREAITESIFEDVSYDDIKDEFKEVVQEEIDNM